MNTIIYNQEGENIGEILLPKEIFGYEVNFDLVHQVAVSQAANRRRVIAHTKDRGEVSGGGKKPWRQKGTGRARHGSIRSPIWKGGGVVFGPTKNRVFKKIITKKMKRLALFMVLSAKAKSKSLLLIDNLKVEKPKTKVMKNFLEKLPSWGKSSLISLPNLDRNVVLASRNLPMVETIETRNLNCLDLLSFKYLIMPKESIQIIKETFLKNKWQS